LRTKDVLGSKTARTAGVDVAGEVVEQLARGERPKWREVLKAFAVSVLKATIQRQAKRL